jgi:hypothetical protein
MDTMAIGFTSASPYEAGGSETEYAHQRDFLRHYLICLLNRRQYRLTIFLSESHFKYGRILREDRNFAVGIATMALANSHPDLSTN